MLSFVWESVHIHDAAWISTFTENLIRSVYFYCEILIVMSLYIFKMFFNTELHVCSVEIFCLYFHNLILKLASNICAHLQKDTGYENQLFWRKWDTFLECLEPKRCVSKVLLSEDKFKVFEEIAYNLHQKYLNSVTWKNCEVICQNTQEWI